MRDGSFEAVFGGTIGNNLHLGAEIVANAALLQSIGKGSAEQNLQIFFEDVQSMAHNLTTFMEAVTILITERALGTALRSAASLESVAVTQSYSEVSVPYFCRPDRKSA